MIFLLGVLALTRGFQIIKDIQIFREVRKSDDTVNINVCNNNKKERVEEVKHKHKNIWGKPFFLSSAEQIKSEDKVYT